MTPLPKNRRDGTNTNSNEKARMAGEDREAEEPLGGIIVSNISSNPQLNGKETDLQTILVEPMLSALSRTEPDFP